MLLTILLAVTIGSILSLSGGFLLLLKKSLSTTLNLLLISFAAGVLLGTAFLDLFPESLAGTSSPDSIFTWAIGGVVFFFLLEKLLLWYHHHHEAHEVAKPSVFLVTIGDGLHNAIDGVAIAASFLANPALGLATTIAVAAHEIPQELADFSVLLSHGLKKSRAIFLNLLSAFTSLVTAVLTFYLSPAITDFLPSIIAFTAGMFTYIACSDLIPELHDASAKKHGILRQTLLFLTGIALVYVAKLLLPEP